MRAMTALYRYFDADELLLYVGISKQPINRLGQHRQDKSWWEQISTVRIERYRTRAEALDAERDAIINAYWYGAHLDPGLRDAVCALTGWSAIHWSSDHWMRSKEAYDAVYGATYDRLPDCQPECWCANTGHGAELRALLADVPSGGTIAPLFTPRAIDPPDYDAMGSLEDFALLFGDEMGVR